MVEIQWHSQTKARATANTNFNLHRRASPRPYLREALGEISGACSPDLTIGRAIAIRYDTEMLAVKADGESAGLVSEWADGKAIGLMPSTCRNSGARGIWVMPCVPSASTRAPIISDPSAKRTYCKFSLYFNELFRP
jgi:hypothetical protein